MRRFLIVLGILACLMSAGGCGLLKKRSKPAQADNGTDRFLGVIESVNPEQKFVLVRTEYRMTLPPGTKLESRALNGTRASLVVTPERKMNFLSADIDEGTPAAGDAVILPAPSAPVSSETAATSSAPSTVPAMRVPDAVGPELPGPEQ
jgi:hypothetical protein